MHIPTGKFEGKEIKCFGEENLPLTPRELTVKEEIFDIIASRITESAILALNETNGLYGIEALSRGAKKVVFVGANKSKSQTIAENLKNIGAEKAAIIKPISVAKYFADLKPQEKFNVIFFKVERQEEVGAEAAMVKHLVEDGLIIMFVPVRGGFKVPVAVEGACIQESRDCEAKVVLVISKNR